MISAKRHPLVGRGLGFLEESVRFNRNAPPITRPRINFSIIVTLPDLCARTCVTADPPSRARPRDRRRHSSEAGRERKQI